MENEQVHPKHVRKVIVIVIIFLVKVIFFCYFVVITIVTTYVTLVWEKVCNTLFLSPLQTYRIINKWAILNI